MIFLVRLIRAYQRVSFLLGPRCRFYPSCSEYMAGSLTTHGVRKGVGLGLRRLIRCHPWNSGGVDLVPPSIHSY